MPVNLCANLWLPVSVVFCLVASYSSHFGVVAKEIHICRCMLSTRRLFPIVFRVLALGLERGWLLLSLFLVAC